MKSDSALALGVGTTFALFLLFGVSTIEQTTGLSFEKSYVVGPRFFPYLAGGAVFVCSIGLLIFPGADEARAPLTWLERANLGIAILAIAVPALTLQTLGFVLSGMISAGLLVFWFSSLKWYVAILFVVALPVVISVLFEYGFRLELPQGAVLGAIL